MVQAVRRQLDLLFAVHMAIAAVTGAFCFLTPHSLMSPILGDASNNTHMAHEFLRLYGASACSHLSLSLCFDTR